MKNLCVDCQLAQKEKDKHLCEKCAHEALINSFKDIRVDVPENQYF